MVNIWPSSAIFSPGSPADLIQYTTHLVAKSENTREAKHCLRMNNQHLWIFKNSFFLVLSSSIFGLCIAQCASIALECRLTQNVSELRNCIYLKLEPNDFSSSSQQKYTLLWILEVNKNCPLRQRYKTTHLKGRGGVLMKIHLLIFSRVIFNVSSTYSVLPKKILTQSKLIATCCG